METGSTTTMLVLVDETTVSVTPPRVTPTPLMGKPLPSMVISLPGALAVGEKLSTVGALPLPPLEEPLGSWSQELVAAGPQKCWAKVRSSVQEDSFGPSFKVPEEIGRASCRERV